SGVTSMARLRNQLQNGMSAFHGPRGASINAASASVAKASIPSEKQTWNGRRGRSRRMATASIALLTIASAPDNHSIVRTVICTAYLGSVKCCLLQFGPGLSRHVLAGEIDSRAHRALEMLARNVRLSERPRHDARVILDLGIAGQLRRAVPKQRPRALV